MLDDPDLLQARDLTVRAGAQVLLAGVDLAIGPGERVAVLGPSGAGKSLLVRALLGVLPPTLEVTGRVVRPARTAWVQQDPSLALHPSVPVGRQLARRRRDRDRVRTVLADVGLDPDQVVGAVPSGLSGGERQRACVALAVLARAEVLLADEPTTALDTLSQAAVVEALRRAPGALVLVTHDVAVAAALCTRALVVADGRVVEDAPVGRLLRDPRHPVTRALVDLAPGRSAA